MCDQTAETIDHILLGCSLTREVWVLVLARLNLHSTIVVRDENVFQWWLTARKQLPKLLRTGFDSLFFLVGWLIWKERNARTFNGVGRPAVELAALI